MLILLPPSEAKARGGRGRPLDLGSLSFPELTATRRAVLDSLIGVSGRDDALEVLGVPAGAADQVEANAELKAAPTRPASAVYTGVLYDALGYGKLSPAAKRRASRSLVVISALFGALRPSDRIPAYRLSMATNLPGVGPLATAWRAGLDEVLPRVAGRGVVVDMRSAAYGAAWRPSGNLAERTVAIHIVRDEAGGRSVVSHMAKHTRGVVARTLLEGGSKPATPAALAEELSATFRVDLDAPRPNRPRRLEVVEPSQD